MSTATATATATAIMLDPFHSWQYPAFHPAVWVVVLLLMTAAVTRVLSGRSSSSTLPGEKGVQTVAMLPYWIPLLGHGLSLVTNFDGFLKRASYWSPHGVFSLNVGGSTTNVVFTPSLIKAVFSQRAGILCTNGITWQFIIKVFGAKPSHKKDMIKAFPDLHTAVNLNLLRDPALSNMVHVTVRNLQEHISNLVTFSRSAVDQSLWERTSDPTLIADDFSSLKTPAAVEVSLFPLIRNFVGHNSLPSLMGMAFMEYYPTVLDDIWDLDAAFILLFVGIPRGFPIQSVAKAHLAQHRLNASLAAFHQALDDEAAGKDPGPAWRDMSDVSQLMKDRNAAYRAHHVPSGIRGPGDLGLIWAMHANANNLVFWILLHIWATPGLVSRVRAEITPFAPVSQPNTNFAFHEPPQLKIYAEGLLKECPLLKACFWEALRMDSSPTSAKAVNQDFVIKETVDDVQAGVEPRAYLLKAGTHIIVPAVVHQHNPRFYPSPHLFEPERFLVHDEKNGGKLTASSGTLRPWGGGFNICKGRAFAEREVLAFVAGILMVWDFEPVGGRGWEIPGHTAASGVCVPSTNVRVRIRRRNFT